MLRNLPKVTKQLRGITLGWVPYLQVLGALLIAVVVASSMELTSGPGPKAFRGVLKRCPACGQSGGLLPAPPVPAFCTEKSPQAGVRLEVLLTGDRGSA